MIDTSVHSSPIPEPTSSEHLSKNQERVKGFRRLQPHEKEYVIRLLGPDLLPYITSLQSELLISEALHGVPAEEPSFDTPFDSPTHLLKYLLSRVHVQTGKYSRTDYSFVLDDKLVSITGWDPIAKRGEGATKKEVQIDFMFKAHYGASNARKDAYTATKPADEIPGTGLQTDAREFLERMVGLIRSIDPACQINMVVSDERRSRLYRRLLKDIPNVKYFRHVDPTTNT